MTDAPWPLARWVERVKVFVLADDHELHRAFAKQVLGLFPYQLRSIWDRQVFSGTGQAPIPVADEAEMLRVVGSLLLWLGQFSVRRLRRVATALPLLAESRYAELREILPQVGGRLTPNDELDQLSQTAQALTDRMEQLQHDREEAESRLVWLADHDPLTRLHNRRRFNEDFQRILDQAQRYGHQGAVLFLDLDQFKDINDLSGHQVGDLMLRRIADQLTQLIRPSDLFARLGGDEFPWSSRSATRRRP